MKCYDMVFSPTGGTQKVATCLINAMGGEVTRVDLTDSKRDFHAVQLTKDDVAVISVPSYGGRVPAVAVERLTRVNGHSARAVLVCVYGNRAYEDTLVELEDAAKEAGFRVIAAVAAVAEHSIARQFASGRPDAQDVQQLTAFASQIQRKLSLEDSEAPALPGNRPYKKAGGAGMVPKPTRGCTGCGVCAEKCPVQAIDKENPKKVDEKACISCMRCVSVCPHAARQVNPVMLAAVGLALKKVCSKRRERMNCSFEARERKTAGGMKTGIIDVGGGLRGIYAVGILDYCMDHGIRFDLGIGVSAGSANLASYAAGQRGRNHQFYTEYAFRKQYMSARNFMRKKSFIDMDYVYGTLSRSDGENPLDYRALRDNPMELYVVASNARTGETCYFDKRDIHQDDYSIFKASCAIPFICKPYAVQGVPYFDGALGDPVPVEKAFQLGCDDVVVVLTKPEHELRTAEMDKRLAAHIRRRYPAAAQRLCERAQRYNAGVAAAQAYARQGKALILSPDDTCGVTTLKRDKPSLQRLYEKGYADGAEIPGFLHAIHAISAPLSGDHTADLLPCQGS